MDTQAKSAVAAVLLFVAAGCISPVKTAGNGEPSMGADSRRELAERVCAGWSNTPRLAARLMMQRYGPPDEVGSSRLVWYGNGPWKRTLVRDIPPRYASAAEDELGVIEQTAAYSLTPQQAADLAVFDARLAADSARMELSSRADREEINFLRLNLANDILHGIISPQEAADLYTHSLVLEASGKMTPYMLSLRFGFAPMR